MYKFLPFALIFWFFIAVASMFGAQGLFLIAVITAVFFLMLRVKSIRKARS